MNHKNLGRILAALGFGVVASAFPALGDSVSLNISTSPGSVLVGNYQWAFQTSSAATETGNLATGISFNGGTTATEIAMVTSASANRANYGGSQVIDFTVTPTIDNGKAASLTFQGILYTPSTGVFDLVFAPEGSTITCTGGSGCYNTGYGPTVNNNQYVISNNGVQYTVLSENGINYEIQTTTVLKAGGATALNGVVVAPEPATYATTGMAFTCLGLALRRRMKRSTMSRRHAPARFQQPAIV